MLILLTGVQLAVRVQGPPPGPEIQPKHRCCVGHKSVEECQCAELQLTKEEMVPVGTWLGVGKYNERKSWRIELLKRYRVWRGFVAAQRQQPRPGSSWLVLRPPADIGMWLHSYIAQAMSLFSALKKDLLSCVCDLCCQFQQSTATTPPDDSSLHKP